VPPGDAEALAAGLALLAADPARRIEMGRAGRALAEREVGPERHWEALSAAYTRAFEKRGRRAA